MRMIKLYALTLSSDSLLSDMWDNRTYRVIGLRHGGGCIGFGSKDPSSKKVVVLIPANLGPEHSPALSIEANPESKQYITGVDNGKSEIYLSDIIDEGDRYERLFVDDSANEG